MFVELNHICKDQVNRFSSSFCVFVQNFKVKMLHLFIVVLVATSHITVNNAFKMQPRIVRGYEAGPAQFPYYAFLEIEHLVEMGPVMGCGATLISNEYILTAAHCLTEASKLHVHLGMYDFSQYFDPEHIIITVEKKDFLIYPRYFKPIAWNDIGLFQSQF